MGKINNSHEVLHIFKEATYGDALNDYKNAMK